VWEGALAAGGPPWLWRLLDPRGGALRVGPVRTGTGATRRVPAHEQRYRPSSNVAELVLGPPGQAVRILDVVPWPGPNERPPGRLIRLVTALAGPVDIEIEVVPAGRFEAARE